MKKEILERGTKTKYGTRKLRKGRDLSGHRALESITIQLVSESNCRSFLAADVHNVSLRRLRIKDSGDASHLDRLVSYAGSIDAMIGEKSPKI
jgi:hypothetical protein